MPHQPTSVLNTQPDIHYIHSDHLNTPQRITNTAQQTVWAADYQPFGQASITAASITNPNPLRFPGQYYDEETNLHYNYFRDYDPTTGRYIQSDPIGLVGGMNTYGYVGGNPVYWSDPFGLAPMTPTDLINSRIASRDTYKTSFLDNPSTYDEGAMQDYENLKSALEHAVGIVGAVKGAQICVKFVAKHKTKIQKTCLAFGFGAAICGGKLDDLDDIVAHSRTKDEISRRSVPPPTRKHDPKLPRRNEK